MLVKTQIQIQGCYLWVEISEGRELEEMSHLNYRVEMISRTIADAFMARNSYMMPILTPTFDPKKK